MHLVPTKLNNCRQHTTKQGCQPMASKTPFVYDKLDPAQLRCRVTCADLMLVTLWLWGLHVI